jgi:hypothetical protein
MLLGPWQRKQRARMLNFFSDQIANALALRYFNKREMP